MQKLLGLLLTSASACCPAACLQHAGVLRRYHLEITAALPLISLVVKQDPIVGGKPPRSPILSRRSYLSPIRGRRVGGMSSLDTELTGKTFYKQP